MKLFLRAAQLVFMMMPVALGGCATYDMIKPPPAGSASISVVYSNEGPSSWTDLPIGTYHVPNRNVIVSGYQKGGGIGGIFGVFGVLAEDAVETRVGEGSVNNVEAALHIDLTRMLTR
jgi:uncharacterized membrane protein